MITINLYENPYSSWAYNVIDEFKPLNQAQIKEEVQKRTFPFAVCIQNLQHDFNISSVIRNANAFGVRQLFYFGQKRFDRRGAKGCYHYMDIQYISQLEELKKLQSKYNFVAAENIEGAKPLDDFEWPENPMILIGEESLGLTKDLLDLADYKVIIKQFGSVRSLNAATASGIMMYDFVSKFSKKKAVTL